LTDRCQLLQDPRSIIAGKKPRRRTFAEYGPCVRTEMRYPMGGADEDKKQLPKVVNTGCHSQMSLRRYCPHICGQAVLMFELYSLRCEVSGHLLIFNLSASICSRFWREKGDCTSQLSGRIWINESAGEFRCCLKRTALTHYFSLHLHPHYVVGAVILDNAIASGDLIFRCRFDFRSPFSPYNMKPVSGDYVESRHNKRPVEHSSDSTGNSSESDHFWDTTTSATDTDTAARIRSPKKRPRLQYRDHIDSFQSDDSWRTETTATSLTEAAVDQGAAQQRTGSGQWVLRRNRSNVSVSSTRTEGSDHDEATAVHSNRSPSFSSPASTPRSSRPASLIFVAENSSDAESSQQYQQQQEQQPQPQPQPQHYQGDGDGLQQQMESLTSRVENWSLTNIRALRRNNVFEDSSAASSQRRQVRAAKRDVMRVLRRSNNSLRSSVMSSCSNIE
jgi:hypothetical protein